MKLVSWKIHLRKPSYHGEAKDGKPMERLQNIYYVENIEEIHINVYFAQQFKLEDSEIHIQI